jgi:hypothetical protein
MKVKVFVRFLIFAGTELLLVVMWKIIRLSHKFFARCEMYDLSIWLSSLKVGITSFDYCISFTSLLL